ASGQDAPSAIAVDDTNVYWAAGGRPSQSVDAGPSAASIQAVPLRGGETIALASGLVTAGPLVAHGGFVVFATAADPAGSGSVINRVDRTGGSVTPLAEPDRAVDSITVDDTTEHWVDRNISGLDVAALGA